MRVKVGRLVIVWLVVAGCAWSVRAEEKPAAKATTARITGKAAIRQALEQKIDVNFDKTPLKDALDALSEKLHVAIHPVYKSLDDVCVTHDTPVTFEQTQVTGVKALGAILVPLELDWRVEEQCLLVTSDVLGDSMLENVIYDVTDLVLVQDPAGEWADNFEPLVNAVRNGVCPRTWGNEGYGGTVTPLSLPISALLVVSQSREVHEEVKQFLAELRRLEDAHGKATLAKPTPEQMLRRRRRVGAETSPPAMTTDSSSAVKGADTQPAGARGGGYF